MVALNVRAKADPLFTHEGAPAALHLTAEQKLRRSVLSCLLWEREFYEDGEEIAARITRLAGEVPPPLLASLAIEARSQFNLRHVPLLLLSVLAKTGSGSRLVSETIAAAIQRADELTEFLAIYAHVNGVAPDNLKGKISAQVKKGLSAAFRRFDAYQLAKYDRGKAVRLRDSLFLCHAKPKDAEQDALWKSLVDGTLPSPDTWEVNLSGGADKKETFERLIREGKLGYLAVLRNLRNMMAADCDPSLVRDAILARKGAQRILPFRYIAAARACPQMEPALDEALCEAISSMPIMPGRTAVLVDISGSMNERLSAKSDLTRFDAAAALASVINGNVRMFSFSDNVVEVPPRRGMAGIDALNNSQRHNRTRLFDAIAAVNANVPYDRLIVITDEQSHPATGQLARFGTWGFQRYEQSQTTTCPDPAPNARGYFINVASAQNGVGYGRWVHLDGFSEQVLRFISEHEARPL